jgi:hypothetical protein
MSLKIAWKGVPDGVIAELNGLRKVAGLKPFIPRKEA